MYLAKNLSLNNKVEKLDGTSHPLVCNYGVVRIENGGQIQFLGDVRFSCQKIIIKDSSVPAMIIGADNSRILLNFEIVQGQFLMDISGNANGMVDIVYETLQSGASIDVVPKYSLQQYP